MGKIKYNAGDDPGFDKKHGILKNKLGITDKNELLLVEMKLLRKAYKEADLKYPEDHIFTDEDICYLHKLFLGELYKWAGQYRSVDISSEDMRYSHAQFIPNNMENFSDFLSEKTPFSPELSREEILERLAQIHGELIIIHPFRDGNGRTTRLLCDLLLIQAGYDPFDTTAFYDTAFVKHYHKAIRVFWHTNNTKMLVDLFSPLLNQQPA